jgi:hypothetical protein
MVDAARRTVRPGALRRRESTASRPVVHLFRRAA